MKQQQQLKSSSLIVPQRLIRKDTSETKTQLAPVQTPTDAGTNPEQTPLFISNHQPSSASGWLSVGMDVVPDPAQPRVSTLHLSQSPQRRPSPKQIKSNSFTVDGQYFQGPKGGPAPQVWEPWLQVQSQPGSSWQNIQKSRDLEVNVSCGGCCVDAVQLVCLKCFIFLTSCIPAKELLKVSLV